MNIADFTLTSFDQMLGTFDHLLAKAEADPRGEALIAEKLADDMYPLATQVRFTTHQVVNTLNRLTGTSIATQDSDHTSLAEARAHIAETRELIKNAHGKGFVADDSPVSFDLPNGMAFEMSAAEYVRDWSLPQFYFHLMAAYSILRKAGIPLGKADYVGYVARHAKVSA
ncbi:DUF1993 domain-containing protein [uncultured Sphingorhabdus sp.]|uniref:DUF1993 domain-containing protein n=1 Tax=uncultured Sphingorhabdus sp. TaxID=1686106 RepID=UPI00260B101C|nr:DUF1993 domain-containing protein [uncultured Sphingorhabdus sp.]HMS18936.1 DUF1993 domain-containing protein [Sphingorhabdus sp.]